MKQCIIDLIVKWMVEAMTTKQIDYCIELAHTLNFSRAAENMFVSQPTFSYQITCALQQRLYHTSII